LKSRRRLRGPVTAVATANRTLGVCRRKFRVTGTFGEPRGSVASIDAGRVGAGHPQLSRFAHVQISYGVEVE